MLAIINQARINGITICNVQKAAPTPNHQPKQPKRGERTVADHPLENASGSRIYGNPNPDFDFFEPTKV